MLYATLPIDYTNVVLTLPAKSCQDGRSDGRDTCLDEMQKPCERLYQSYLLGNCSTVVDGEERVRGYVTVNDANGKGDYLNFRFSNTGHTDGCTPVDLCQAMGV